MAKKKSNTTPKKDNKQETLNDFVSSPYGTGSNENHNTKKQSEGRNTSR